LVSCTLRLDCTHAKRKAYPGDLDGSGEVDAGDIGSLLLLFN
jgi:hypothetical protein